MAAPRLTFDVSGEEDSLNFYAGSDPERGTYRAKVANIDLGKSKADKDMLTIRYEIVEGPYKGWAGWDRITLEASTAWKLKQLVSAVGYKSQKGEINALMKFATGKVVGILVKNGSDQSGNPRAEINRPFPASALGKSEDLSVTSDAEDAAADEREAEEEDEQVTYTEEELKELSKADLYAVATEDFGLKGFTTKSPATKLIAAIMSAQEPDDEEEDEEEEDEDDPRAERESELSELDRNALKRVLKSAAPTFAVKKSHSDDDLRAAILDAEFGEESDEEEEEDGEPPF
jgi:hypothetical protein